MGKMIDLTNKRYGRLTVIQQFDRDKYGQIRWLCKCDCGNTSVVTGSNLRNGHIKSCKCLQKEIISKTHKKHGMYGTPIYTIWSGMIQRCTNPNNSKFKNYGARGITVCSAWRNDFNKFYQWAINHCYQAGLTIDRIDVNGNYEPNNCRWTNLIVQENNRTNNYFITIDNATKTLSEWSRVSGIRWNTIRARIERGWDVKDAVFAPVKSRRKIL